MDLKILSSSKCFTVLDIETSGLSPAKGGRIIEIGAVKVVNGQFSKKYSQLINPELKISKKTTELTGITNEMLQGQPIFRQALPEFCSFLGDDIVVIHNKAFDWDRFLLEYFKKSGIFPKNTVVDTIGLSKFLYPNEKAHNLDIICERLGIQNNSRHRALGDAEVTAKIAIAFIGIFQNSIGDDSLMNQMSLMGSESQKLEKTEPTAPLKYRIRRVACWPKTNQVQGKRYKGFRRVYVNLDIGTVFFDCMTQTWGNKDIDQEINFQNLQADVLKHLHLSSITDLCNFASVS